MTKMERINAQRKRNSLKETEHMKKDHKKKKKKQTVAIKRILTPNNPH